MYMNRMLSVSKAQNGYVVEITVPLKPDTKASDKMICCQSSTDKQYIAADIKAVSDLIEDLMPLLDGDYKTESDFDKAFADATNETSAEEKGEDS